MDFRLTFERHGRFYTVSAEAEGVQPLPGRPFSFEDLDRALRRLAHQDRGRILYDIVFADRIRDLFELLQRRAEREGFTLGIDLDFTQTPELADLPWKDLYNPEAGFLLSRHPLRRSPHPSYRSLGEEHGNERSLGSRESTRGAYSIEPEPDDPVRSPTAEPPFPPPQRFLQGRFPAPVRLGDHVVLQVRIALERGGAGERSAALREVLVPPEGLTALLVFHCPGFENRGGNSREVHIPQTRSSDWVPLELKAIREGVQTLEVSAYAGGAYLGALQIEATVDGAATTGESRDHRQSLRNRRRQEGDLILEIRYDESAQSYRFNWIDDSLIPVGELSQRLRRTPREAIESLIRELNEQAGGISSYTAGQTQRRLRNEGIRLWKELIPEDLRRQFWKCRDRIRRLLIISEGDPIPWELLYPSEPGTSNDAGFLAEQFPISRWLRRPAEGPSSSLRLSNAAFVGPDDSLPHARREIETIRGILAGRGARTREPIQRLSLLLDLLDQGGFDLLHFACHNQFETEGILIGDQAFEPVFLEEHENRLSGVAPLVFLNACHSDSHLPQYTQLGGWAHSFLRAGAGAFLGTLWQVRDETASAFAEAFYRALTPGARLGEALQQARMEARDVAGDPTWLAYALYGDTFATLE